MKLFDITIALTTGPSERVRVSAADSVPTGGLRRKSFAFLYDCVPAPKGKTKNITMGKHTDTRHILW